MDEGAGRLHARGAGENSAARYRAEGSDGLWRCAAARVTSVQTGNNSTPHTKGDENIAKLYRREAFAGTERLLVDPDKLPAPEGKHYAVDYFAASPDNKYIAYGISIGGSEESVLHVIDLATGKETGDVIDRANFGSPSWVPDGRLLYNRLQKPAPNAAITEKYVNSRAYVHVLARIGRDAHLLGAGSCPTSDRAAEITSRWCPIARSTVGLSHVSKKSSSSTCALAAIAERKTPG